MLQVHVVLAELSIVPMMSGENAFVRLQKDYDRTDDEYCLRNPVFLDTNRAMFVSDVRRRLSDLHKSFFPCGSQFGILRHN